MAHFCKISLRTRQKHHRRTVVYIHEASNKCVTPLHGIFVSCWHNHSVSSVMIRPVEPWRLNAPHSKHMTSINRNQSFKIATSFRLWAHCNSSTITEVRYVMLQPYSFTTKETLPISTALDSYPKEIILADEYTDTDRDKMLLSASYKVS